MPSVRSAIYFLIVIGFLRKLLSKTLSLPAARKRKLRGVPGKYSLCAELRWKTKTPDTTMVHRGVTLFYDYFPGNFSRFDCWCVQDMLNDDEPLISGIMNTMNPRLEKHTLLSIRFVTRECGNTEQGIIPVEITSELVMLRVSAEEYVTRTIDKVCGQKKEVE